MNKYMIRNLFGIKGFDIAWYGVIVAIGMVLGVILAKRTNEIMSPIKMKDLFFTFFKIGAFTFGGGYAMIPLIKREVIENKKWLTEAEIYDIIAIAESTPGPLAVNAATFVGSRVCGFWGAFLATFGVILPSFLIISLLANLLLLIENNSVVQYAFQGIRIGVLVLICNALLSMYKQMKKNLFSYLIVVMAFLLVFLLKVNTIIILILCALAGVIYSLLRKGAVK